MCYIEGNFDYMGVELEAGLVDSIANGTIDPITLQKFRNNSNNNSDNNSDNNSSNNSSNIDRDAWINRIHSRWSNKYQTKAYDTM